MNESPRNPVNHSALGQYQTVNAYGAAAAGDRVQLIARLMQGAMDRLVTAKGHMLRQEVAAKGEQLQKALSMIEGLRVSLDHSQGGEIARNLESLYEYMVRRLTIANLHNEPALIDEVVELLAELRAGWEEMGRNVNLRPAEAAAPASGRALV